MRVFSQRPSNQKNQNTRLIKVKHSRQAGFSLIELAMVLVIAGLLFMAYMSWSSYKARESEARATGNNVAQYIAAVNAKLATDTVHAGDTFTGVNWLLPTSCGGSSTTAYLPCGFIINSQVMRTPPVVTVNNIGTGSRLSVTINFGTITSMTTNGVLEPNPGLAASVVNAARAYYGSVSNGAFNGITSYDFDKVNATFQVNIVLQGTQDVWLRVDGGNSMQNNITYNPSIADDKRQLLNVSTISMQSATQAQITSNGAPLLLSGAASSVKLGDGSGNITMSANNNIGINSVGELSLNRDSGGDIYLGKQNGVKGDSNVHVNDLTIASKGNTKLTDYLGMVFVRSYKIDQNTTLIPFDAHCTATGGINKIFLLQQMQEVKQFPVKFSVSRGSFNNYVDIAFSVPYATSGIRAQTNGNSWQIVQHNLTQFEAIAEIYCDYSNK
ncbi:MULTISPECIES: type II secretion system protein [Cysteiniphilum]|uniref:Prepilin-type N-terminal cleavage/methylation domain-containing protein n=1 Tax=Cysteiniphilum litorale TaxID=2056700 RepID=A0A8J3E7R7_9GAMM|nr:MULTISPECIES: prepilin-type N-terminal cleavage/methylation domain-containing protein [Cysteiniphilum]GGF92681.1 hypothetical protein GCM10010995_07300 [Cysteiniphilum litorale]